jgi:putative CocE/NonD family hydrolase
MASHSPARDQQYLLIGPWDHVQTLFGGEVRMGEMEFSPEATLDIIELHQRFYDHYLKKAEAAFAFPRARIYVTGSNQWRDLDAYPPQPSQDRRLYLHSGGRANSLSGDGSLKWNPAGEQPADSYDYDPQNPVSVDSGDQPIMLPMHGTDQRPIEQRDDVLIYTGEVLEQPLEIIGPVTVELYAASDAQDTDFAAKLVDVYPDGRAVRLGPVNTGIIRARFRNGFGTEQLLTPGKVEKYRIPLADIGHTFLPGHRVRLEISSSAYPQVLPNQNTGNPIATDTDWRIARQTIHHDSGYPSAVILPVFAGEAD